MKKLLFLWALLISTVLQVNAQTWTWVGEEPIAGSFYIYSAVNNVFVKKISAVDSNPANATLFTLSAATNCTISYEDNGTKYVYESTGNQSWGTTNTNKWIIARQSNGSYYIYHNDPGRNGRNRYIQVSGTAINYPYENFTGNNRELVFISPARLEAQQTVYNSHYNDYKDAYDAVVAKYPTLDILNELNTANYRDVEEKIDRLNQILENGTFANPLLQQDAADPTVLLAEDGYYYMCCSEKNQNEGLPLWRSADMINWTKVTNIFPKSERPSEVSYTFLWAPELAYVNGKYVLFYANAEWGSEGNTQICVATSRNPWGPYENKVLVTAHKDVDGALNADVDNVIDPSLFRDTDGKNYLIWGSWHGIYYVELDASCTGLAPDAAKKSLAEGTEGDWTKIEAPMVTKHDGYYYLIASKGTTAGTTDASKITYQLVMGRSKTLGGTFVDPSGNNVFSSYWSGLSIRQREMYGLLSSNDYVLGPGHCSQIVKDKNGTEWIFYHGYKRNGNNWDLNAGRVLFASKVEWSRWTAEWPGIMPPSASFIEKPVVDAPTIEYPVDFEISTEEELMAFAEKTRNGQTWINAKLMNDIDMDGKTWAPIGTVASPFRGTIDGQNHRIKNLTASGSNDVALVGVVDGGAEFKNIIIDKSCSFSGVSQVAGFVGHAKGSGTLTFTNCGNEATVTATDANASGFLGYTSGISTYWTNCYNAGDIKGGKESAAFSGWCGDHLLNCWNSGKVGGADGDENNKLSLTRGEITQGYANTYELNSSNASVTGMPEGYTPEWLADGRLAYYMNQTGGEAVWTQKVDNVYGDEREGHPTFGSKEVIKSGNIYHNEMYYTRDIKEGTYGTICLPYASGSIEGADIYEVAGVRKNASGEISSMVVEQVEGQLVAGKPYLFRATCTGNGRDGLYIEYTGSPVIETVNNTGMVGNLTMDKYLIPNGNYFLRTLSTGESVLTLTGESIKANVGSCRAYFSLGDVDDYDPSTASQAKTLVFGLEGVEDDADAIEALNAETTHDSYYNMMGQRVNANAKGLLIKNGKKYLNK